MTTTFTAKDFTPAKPAQITGGTAQEIKEATKVRNEVCKYLGRYAISFTSDGRPSTLYQTARQDIDAVNRAAQESEREAAAYRDLAERIARYNRIVTDGDAQHWLNSIDPVTRIMDTTAEKKKRFEKIIDGR